jgi:dCTP deaminase
MFLPKEKILARAAEKELISDHFEPSLTQQASYDLRLGSEVYVVGKKAPENLSDKKPYVSLQPGQFAILTCYEEINIPPDILGFIALKTSFKFQGLVNISGFHVDPTHTGTLLFAVQNVGPSDIRLKFKQPTFTIFFSTLAEGSIGDSREKEKGVNFKPKLEGIRLQDVQLLGGGSITLSKLQKDVDRVKLLLLIYGPFGVAAFIALLVALVKLFSTSAAPPPH